MARYWVGGTGNWSDTAHWAASSGGAGGETVPSSTDDVIFDAASNATAYTVTIDATAACANFTVGNPASGVATIAGTAAISIYGNYSLATGVLATYSGGTTFLATATGKTITTNSVALASTFTFNGAGGGWTLQDALNLGSKNFSTLQGSVDTNGQTVTCQSFYTAGALTRALTLGASTINCQALNLTTSTGLTFDAGTSTINALASVFNAGTGLIFNVVVLTVSNGTMTGANTFATLTITGSGGVKTDSVTFNANQTITGTLTLTGNSITERLLVKSNTTGTAQTIAAATVAVTNADFRDITGAGAGDWDLSAATGGSGDAGGNSGITFTTPATQTWQNADGGTWSTAANWTSRVPLPQDDVVMGIAFNTAKTVTADMPRLGKSISWAGATWTTSLTWAMSTATSIFGSLTMIADLTMSGTSTYIFEGRGSYTLTSAGLTLDRGLNLNAPNGTLTLGGDLTMGVTRAFTVLNGTLSCVNGGSNYALNIGLFNMTGGTVTLGSATHIITGASTTAWYVTGGTVTAFTGTIKFTNTSTTGITFVGGGKTYNNVWFARGTSTASNTISGSNTFADLKDDGSVAHSLIFTAGTTQTVTTFTVSGSSGNEITINSQTTGTHTLTKAGGGTIECDYLNIQHSIATPANTWYAGENSTNNQAVETAGSGWTFTTVPTIAEATVSPLTLAITLPALTVSTVEVSSVTLSPLTLAITLPAVTATHAIVTTATPSPILLEITLPLVEATGPIIPHIRKKQKMWETHVWDGQIKETPKRTPVRKKKPQLGRTVSPMKGGKGFMKFPMPKVKRKLPKFKAKITY